MVKAPSSKNLEGWREAIDQGRLKKFRLEDIAAAFQDLDAVDHRVREGLARHLSGAIIGMLRKRVGLNHPNNGEDIIYEVHDEIFEALLKPESADGKALRITFGSRVNFRMKTAIANALRAQVTPLPPASRVKKVDKHKEEDIDTVCEVIEDATKGLTLGNVEHDIGDADDLRDERSSMGDESELSSLKRTTDPALMDGVRETDESIDVERILATIPGWKKRLAFKLYMNAVPSNSKKANSIARACGVSDKTVMKWIEEIQTQLQNNKEAQELQRLKSGAKS